MVLVQACPEYKKNIKKFTLQMSHTSRWNRPIGASNTIPEINRSAESNPEEIFGEVMNTVPVEETPPPVTPPSFNHENTLPMPSSHVS